MNINGEMIYTLDRNVLKTDDEMTSAYSLYRSSLFAIIFAFTKKQRDFCLSLMRLANLLMLGNPHLKQIEKIIFSVKTRIPGYNKKH